MAQAIGDRMKRNYEDRSRYYLTRRTPVILRVDGKCFHTLLKTADKPFDEFFNFCMVDAAKRLCKEISGAKLAYTQSDEISVLVTDFDKLTTEAWFDYNIQKMCSVAAAFASTRFTSMFCNGKADRQALFDCRVFNIPKEEVVNYFIWRQKDWLRNSIQMLARAYYSHKECHGKDGKDLHEMLHEKDINWADLEDRWKNGVLISKSSEGKWTSTDDSLDCPVFTNGIFR